MKNFYQSVSREGRLCNEKPKEVGSLSKEKVPPVDLYYYDLRDLERKATPESVDIDIVRTVRLVRKWNEEVLLNYEKERSNQMFSFLGEQV